MELDRNSDKYIYQTEIKIEKPLKLISQRLFYFYYLAFYNK